MRIGKAFPMATIGEFVETEALWQADVAKAGKRLRRPIKIRGVAVITGGTRTVVKYRDVGGVVDKEKAVELFVKMRRGREVRWEYVARSAEEAREAFTC
jgi:hypothetical protein